MKSEEIIFNSPKRINYDDALELLPKYLHLKGLSFFNAKANKRETIINIIIAPANDPDFYNCILEGTYTKSFEKAILRYRENKVQITCILEGLSKTGAIRSINIKDVIKHIKIYEEYKH